MSDSTAIDQTVQTESVQPLCAYCHTEADEELRFCGACGSAYHRACWEENSGCAVAGCSGSSQTTTTPGVVAYVDGLPPPAPAGMAAFPQASAATMQPIAAPMARPRLGLTKMIVSILLIGLPVLASVGTTQGWFSAITGQVYGESDISEARSSGFEAGESSGYDGGYEAGKSAGFDSGFDSGYSSGWTDGCSDVFDYLGTDTVMDWYDEGFYPSIWDTYSSSDC